MSNEMSKSHNARFRNGDYEHLRGRVLDIGCGPDKIVLSNLQAELSIDSPA